MSKTPENRSKVTFIYTLADPVTKEVRYVGKTVKTLSQRLTGHIYSSKKESNHRANWIKSLLRVGRKPLIEYLDICSWDESQKLEIYWISQFISWGFNLINLTEGGEGNLGRNISVENKRKLLIANRREVYQYDREGNFIRSFSSITEAAKYLKMKNSGKISLCASGKRRLSGGYRWSYNRLENLGDIKPNLKGTTNKKVVSFNGEQRLFMKLCKEFNINYQTLRSRLNKGMTIEEAISKKVRSKRTNIV